MNIKNNIIHLRESLPSNITVVAVSKTQPLESIQAAYEAGQRVFGENKAQELKAKYEALPKDIAWHMIGHLQTNKVKYIAPFVQLIHSVDSLRLLQEIHTQGQKAGRTIPCLLQIHIAREETKFGFSEAEALQVFSSDALGPLDHIQIVGLMGMASFTENKEQVRQEFRGLKLFFDQLKEQKLPSQVDMKELSMGMSGDFTLGIEEGATMVRIGTGIFGQRNQKP